MVVVTFMGKQLETTFIHNLTSIMSPSVMSPSIMSFLVLYPKILGNKCVQFKSPSLLSHFPLTCHNFDIKIIHQKIKITHLHASHCHHYHYCHYWNVVLFYDVTCYTNSLLSCIYATTIELLNITCTLVATVMILGRLKCSLQPTKWQDLPQTWRRTWVESGRIFQPYSYNRLA